MNISNEEEYNESIHAALSNTPGQAARIQNFEMTDDNREEVYIKINTIIDLQYALQNISEKQWHDLAN